MEPLAVVGGGAWGTAMAVHLGRRGHPVTLWIRETDLVARMRARRDNPVYLPGIEVPQAVEPVSDLAAAVGRSRTVLFAVPSPYARATYAAMASGMAPRTTVVVGTKGIEEDTLLLPTQVAASCLPETFALAVLSGPSFAEEVARDVPTAVVVASGDPPAARRIQQLLSGDALRLYTSDDVVGVQIAAAAKNVVAIAAGIVDGLGFGQNTIAALVTRGLAEIRRLGVALGAKPETFAGLSGLGDLTLTCTGRLSRNREVGRALGRGERLEDVVSRTRQVAEGVRTARSARELARRAGVEMPIVEEVCRILYEDIPPREAVRRLMTRPLTSERRFEGDAEA